MKVKNENIHTFELRVKEWINEWPLQLWMQHMQLEKENLKKFRLQWIQTHDLGYIGAVLYQ